MIVDMQKGAVRGGPAENLRRGTILDYPHEGLFKVTSNRKSRRHLGWRCIVAQSVSRSGEHRPWKLVLLIIEGPQVFHYHSIYDDRTTYPFSPLQLAEGLG